MNPERLGLYSLDRKEETAFSQCIVNIFHNLYFLLQEGYEVMVLNTNYNSDKGRQIRVSISACISVG